MTYYERIPTDYDEGLPEGELHEERCDEVWYHLSDDYLHVDGRSQLAGVGVQKWWLPLFEKKLGYQYDRNASLDHFDERMDCLATLLAAYPTANTYKLAKEFGLTRNYLMQLVAHYGVYKTEERRHEIRIENGREAFIRMLWAERHNTLR